jgi:hypothetical protein
MPLGSIAHAAGELTAALNAEVPADDAGHEPLIVHLAGFDTVDGELAPVVWFIHNTAGLTAEGRYRVGGRFASTEELRTAQPNTPRFVGMRANEINEALRARRWSNPFWFRQATDLGAVNALDSAVAMAMTAIVETHPARLHPRPQSLTEWSQHLKLAVLTYGAYFESFYPPYEQAIGGGVDVVSAPWPEGSPRSISRQEHSKRITHLSQAWRLRPFSERLDRILGRLRLWLWRWLLRIVRVLQDVRTLTCYQSDRA